LDVSEARTTAAGQIRRRKAARRRLLTVAVSVLAHGAILLAILSAPRDTPPRRVDLEPMTVQLAVGRPVAPAPAPPSPAPPSPAEPPPPKAMARPTHAPVADAPLAAGEGPAADQGVELSEAQLAGAATAGSGASGRPCDMTRRLQTALRRDARVQAAVADAHRAEGSSSSKAMLVWNGDWVRSYGQDGAGLAAVREAIMWEVAFAPEACRAEPVHGLILVSLNDAPGAARLVVGSGNWRWSDLLRPH
jgi:hypothetical protein